MWKSCSFRIPRWSAFQLFVREEGSYDDRIDWRSRARNEDCGRYPFRRLCGYVFLRRSVASRRADSARGRRTRRTHDTPGCNRGDPLRVGAVVRRFRGVRTLESGLDRGLRRPRLRPWRRVARRDGARSRGRPWHGPEHDVPPRHACRARCCPGPSADSSRKGSVPSRGVGDNNTIALNAGAPQGVRDLVNERVKGDNPQGDSGLSRFPRGGRLLGPLFGLVFLIYPVRAVLTSDPTPARISLALVGAALFAGVFLWLMWMQEPLWSASAEPSEVRKRRATIAFLAVLALALNLGLGSEWRVLFFHVNVAAGIMLLTRDAYVAIVGLAATTLALGFVSGMAWLALPTTAIGLWATAFVRQVAAVAELKSAREELARLAVSEERLRFARDLHDLLGHSLSLITLKSELAGRLLPNAPEKAATEVHDIEGVARQALREVREAVAGYRRPTLDEELAGASEMLEAAGISWAMREGTTNVIRHSRAKYCRIVLVRENEEIYAEITDDGGGYQKESGEDSGSGLSGLAERVATFAGRVETNSLPDGGFRLRVVMPARSAVERPAWPEPTFDDSFTGEDRR